PADDHSTWRYNFRFKRSEPMTVEEHYSDKVQVGIDFKLVANRRNEYLLDRETQKTVNYTGIEGFATQDACVTESMAPICDRTKDVRIMNPSLSGLAEGKFAEFTIQSSRIKAHYHEAGEGDKHVIFLQTGGAATSAYMCWYMNLEAFAKAGYHVYACDAVAFG